MIPIYVRTSSTGIDLIWPGAWDLSSPETLVCMPPVKYVQLTADNRLFVCTFRIQITHRVNPYAVHFPSYHTSFSSNSPILSHVCRDMISIQITLGIYQVPGPASASSQSLSTREYSSEFIYRGNISNASCNTDIYF